MGPPTSALICVGCYPGLSPTFSHPPNPYWVLDPCWAMNRDLRASILNEKEEAIKVLSQN